MEPVLPTNSEVNHRLYDSFLTAPTDSVGARSAKNDGAAPTLPSMDYTESQSAGQQGAEQANPEDTVTEGDRHVEERDHDREEENAMQARKAFMSKRLAEAFDEDDGCPQSTYAQPESNFPVPMAQTDNMNMVLPTEADIGKSIFMKANIYLPSRNLRRIDKSHVIGLPRSRRRPIPDHLQCKHSYRNLISKSDLIIYNF